ncbi:hypothetical protein Plhal304r1_c017g0062081 [Plasmopara halstedii]
MRPLGVNVATFQVFSLHVITNELVSTFHVLCSTLVSDVIGLIYRPLLSSDTYVLYACSLPMYLSIARVQKHFECKANEPDTHPPPSYVQPFAGASNRISQLRP